MFIVNAEGAIRKENKWLIIERSTNEEHAGGLYSLAGGKAEPEDPSADLLERTVKREIYEEVGVTVKEQLNYIHSTSFMTEAGENVVNIVFLCEYDSGEPFPKSPDEVENVLWQTAEEIFLHPKSPPWLKESIKRAEREAAKWISGSV